MLWGCGTGGELGGVMIVVVEKRCHQQQNALPFCSHSPHWCCSWYSYAYQFVCVVWGDGYDEMTGFVRFIHRF